jgi:DNA invertase Pin-like site-specific DNA recombinase
MHTATEQKVGAAHLARDAYVYIRQSTMRQVLEHTESTKRQYDLRQRAVALGWPSERIVVIDDDLGESGAYVGREGFGRLVSEVGLGKAGVVCSLEVSRFARNSSDWHRLLEICALTDTLILDEEAVYDPSHFNDRLLLGLKGTMSEAELHVIRARLTGGMLNKARRGELALRLPAGFVHKTDGKVDMDPDKEVQSAIRRFFELFHRIGSVLGTVRRFGEEKLLFPTRMHAGSDAGELVWRTLTVSRAAQVLHNPCYAGAYAYGRRQTVRRVTVGRAPVRIVDRSRWCTLIRDAHAGYIDWNEHEENLRRLTENRRSGPQFNRCAPREGPALLQGIIHCSVCGKAMTVRYHCGRNGLIPQYTCRGEGETVGRIGCQSIPGKAIDEAVGRLLIETMTPHALEIALSVQQELQADRRKTDELRKAHVERLRYECEHARRRYLRVDPDNRLVASSLEADWNQRLRDLRDGEDDYLRRQAAEIAVIDEKMQERIRQLSSDFATVWNDTRTADRERKRMVRLLLEDVTVRKESTTTKMYIRFKGGAAKTIDVARPLPYFEKTRVDKKVVEEIDRLLDRHTNGEIAEILNGKALLSGQGRTFDARRVNRVRRAYGLKSRYMRLRDRGYLTTTEVGKRYGVCRWTVAKWRTSGVLAAHRADDQGEHLFEDPGPTFNYCGRRMLPNYQTITKARRGAV